MDSSPNFVLFFFLIMTNQTEYHSTDHQQKSMVWCSSSRFWPEKKIIYRIFMGNFFFMKLNYSTSFFVSSVMYNMLLIYWKNSRNSISRNFLPCTHQISYIKSSFEVLHYYDGAFWVFWIELEMNLQYYRQLAPLIRISIWIFFGH